MLASHLEIRKKPMAMRIKLVDSVTKWHNKRENNNGIDYYLDGSGVDQFAEEDAFDMCTLVYHQGIAGKRSECSFV